MYKRRVFWLLKTKVLKWQHSKKNMNSLIERLEHTTKMSGETQAELMLDVGVFQTTIGKILNGKNTQFFR